MKQQLLFELMNRLKSRPDLRKKVITFAAIGGVVFLVGAVLVIWASVSVIQFAASKVQGVDLQAKVESLEPHLNSLSAVKAVGCWAQIQSLANPEAWLTKPPGTNISGLTSACLGFGGPACSGPDCDAAPQAPTVDENKT